MALPKSLNAVGRDPDDEGVRSARVRRQYESFPYPARDPAHEDVRLLRTSTDALPSLNHWGFAGRKDFRRGFRALVAGGGTGDATTYLAHQLRETDAEIVYLDLSAASMEIARERARRRGLDGRITWRLGSLLDLPDWDLEPFDYVNCSGVLHHLPDPAAGLAALRAVLKDDGLMGLMVYGAYGRSAIYPLQDLLRQLLSEVPDAGERIRAARQLLEALPSTNWFRRTPPGQLPWDLETDEGLYDLLLHSQDRPFTVPGLYELLRGAGLHLVEFVPDFRAFYDPRFVLGSPGLRDAAHGLPREKRQAVAELAWGCLSRHAFWVSPRTDCAADPCDPENVPFFFGPHQGDPRVAAALQGLAPGETGSFTLGGGDVPQMTARLTFDEPSCRFLKLVDGKRTMAEIVAAMTAGGTSPLTEPEAWRACQSTIETLRVADGILHRHVSAPPL